MSVKMGKHGNQEEKRTSIGTKKSGTGKELEVLQADSPDGGGGQFTC